MKVRIEDKEAIDALSWEELRAYLDRAKGWKYAEDIAGGKAAVYQHKDRSGRLREIIVPLRRDLGDYVSRMADAVTTLARIEWRSELDVYEDLSQTGEAAAFKSHDRIRTWLTEEGWQVEDVPAPHLSLNIAAVRDDGLGIHILQHSDHLDHITLSLRGLHDDGARQVIGRLPESALRDAVWEIYRDTSIMGVDCHGIDSPITEMTLRAYVYFDALTKDTLMQRIHLVNRAYRLAMRTFIRALETAGPEGEQAI